MGRSANERSVQYPTGNRQREGQTRRCTQGGGVDGLRGYKKDSLWFLDEKISNKNTTKDKRGVPPEIFIIMDTLPLDF